MPFRTEQIGVVVKDDLIYRRVDDDVEVLDDSPGCWLGLVCSKLRRLKREGTEVNVGWPGEGPPGGGEPAGVGGGRGGAGAEAATDCTGMVVDSPRGAGTGGAEEAAGPPIFLRVVDVDVDVDVVLVRCEEGPKVRLLLGLPLVITIREVGTLADELGGTGTELPTPKRRLEDAAGTLGGGTPGTDEDGRVGVTGGGGGGPRDVTVTVTVFGNGENGGAQKSIVERTVKVDTTHVGKEDGDERGGVTTAEGNGNDGRGIVEDDLGGAGGMLEDVLGGRGDTLGIDELDEEAGAAGLVDMPGTLLVEDSSPTGPT